MLALVVSAALAAPTGLSYASGPLVGSTDLGSAISSRYHVKEVVRFWLDRPCEVIELKAAFAGASGIADVHIWGDIDHQWPFYRFERDLVKPIRVTVDKKSLNQWRQLPVGKNPLIVANPGFLYVGLVYRKSRPRLAVDSKLDSPSNSRYEVYDLQTPRPAKAYWLRPSGDYAVSLRTRPLPEPKRLFQDVTTTMGLGNVQGGSIAWADVDGDGWEDLLVGGKRLFRNVQGKRFEEISSSAKLGQSASFGVFADVDNDGDLDVFLGSGTPDRADRMMLNDGRGRFSLSTSDLNDGWPSKSATWLDYDLDGRVDLFVANGADGIPTRNRLWRNLGKGRFAPAPLKTINEAAPAFNRSAVAADLDLDGRSEVAVSTLRLQPDQLWWISKSSALDRARRYKFDLYRSPSGKTTGGQGAGVAVGDLDNDAKPDLWVTNLMHPDWRGHEASVLSAIFLSGGGKGFTKRDSETLGITYDESPADPTLGDFDNDGDLDVFVGSSYHRGDYYENIGGRFKNATYKSGLVTDRGESSAACDFDHDGRLDLIVCSKGKIRVYRNISPTQNWLEAKLSATGNWVGASVLLKSQSHWQLRQCISGKGLGSQDGPIVHFGLGKATRIEAIRVVWPGGRSLDIRNIDINQLIRISK
jgi:hypothetical protein